MTVRSRTLVMRLLAALAFGALLAGATAGRAYELPEPEIASRADMPRDAVLVLDALVEALRGSGRAVDRVRFAAGVGGDLAEADFRYEGFTYDEAALYRLDEGRNQSRSLAGRVDFSDAVGRRASALVTADYALRDGVLEITKAAATPLFSGAPASSLFIVPASGVEERGDGLPTTYPELLEFAFEASSSWATPDRMVADLRKYVIFVFIRDRISPSASAMVRLDSSSRGRGGFGKASRYLDDNGWRVVIAPGTFALEDERLFVKVVFKAGSEEGLFSRGEKLVGLFFLSHHAAEAREAELTLRPPRPGEAAEPPRGASPRAGVITAAVPGASFDGEWNFRLDLNQGESSCLGVIKAKTEIKGNEMTGSLMHPYVGRIVLTGEIDAAGNLKVSGQGGLIIRANGVAETPTSAKGRADVTVAGFQCSGPWTAEKAN